jgi:hypothetical protein
MFSSCHAVTGMGLWQTAWPDGRSYVEQPAMTVLMFELIRDQLLAHMESESKRSGK